METMWCRCAIPKSLRAEVNYCAYCCRLIPVQPEDMSAEQKKYRTAREQSELPWPKRF